MVTLYKKELKYYLDNPIGYITVVLFSIFVNFLYVKDIFVIGSASMRPFFTLLPWLLMIFVPAVTMRILSEEKRNNTIEILLTLPVSETQVVLSKFLAIFTLVALGLVLTIGLPVSLSFLTQIYLPEILVGYLGALLLGSAFIGLSMFFSSQTKNQVVAFLTSVLAIFLLLVISTDFMANVLPKFIQDFAGYFSPVYHLQNFVKGIVDLRSVFYFASLTLMFLFATIIDLEKRN